MGDQRRWAARYQFLDGLWRGRDRIVCDPELEAALHAGLEGPLAELVDGLVPGDATRDRTKERAWVALHHDRRAASFARAHSGTVFVSLGEAGEIASDEPWQIALVHLGGPSGRAATRAELVGSLESFLEVLGERLEDDAERSVVLSLPCGPDEDASYELLAELVEELFGDGRIYGLAQPSMAAFFDFGPVLEPDDADGSDSSDGGDIEVDNTLGSDSPRFEAFVAIVGAGVPGEGVTFVELPGPAGASVASSSRAGAEPVAGDDELAAVRVQLGEAQRRGDLQAIERQSLLEQLEQAEDRIASLEEQLDAAAERASGSTGAAQARPEPLDAGPRVDALLARERTLRWELDRARGEIERLEARPVEELEAEVAALRAELDQARVDLGAAEARIEALEDGELAAEEDIEPDELDALAELAWLLDEAAADEPTPAQTREWERARSTLDHLLRKLERGASLSALELHRQLVALKRLL